MLQHIDFFRGLVGADVGVRAQGADGLRFQPVPVGVGPDDVGVDARGGLSAAGALAAGGLVPGADPGSGQGLGQFPAVFPNDQVGVG